MDEEMRTRPISDWTRTVCEYSSAIHRLEATAKQKNRSPILSIHTKENTHTTLNRWLESLNAEVP